MRSAIPIFILVLMTAYGPLSMLEELDAPDGIKFSEENNGVHDVPTWRIGDKWVYETQFDVAQLIQQANVSASLNTLTGDTTMEVVDIRFEDIQGVQTLVYEIEIEGFTSGNSGLRYRVKLEDWTSNTMELIFSELATFRCGIQHSHWMLSSHSST